VTERAVRWTPPDGLERSRPREVRLTAAGRGLVFAVVALWLAAVGAWIGLQLVIARGASESRLFRAEAVDAQAEVTRLWRAGDNKRKYRVAYRFEASGRIHERQARVSASTWRALEVGGPLAIRYVPSRPELSFARGDGPDVPPFFLPYVLAGVLGVGACLMPLPLIAQRRLLAEGRPARGQVTRHTRDQHGTKVHYEFRTLAGSRASGKAGPVRKPAAVGSAVCVLYEPDRPGSNMLYPTSLVRLARTTSL
jgi:hypothetical protein